MVNTAFALKFTTPRKLASKCGIYHLCFWFPPSLHFFASYLHRVNFCKSDFSCSELSLKWEENYFLCSTLLLRFAEYSNNINQKKNEVNKKQQSATKLLDEFAREIDVSCQQGRERNILKEQGQLLTCCKHSLVLDLRGWEKDSNKQRGGFARHVFLVNLIITTIRRELPGFFERAHF